MASNSNAKSSFKPISPKETARQQPVAQADLPVVPLSIKLVRLTICGLGVSAIAGTTLSIINPPHQTITKKVATPSTARIANLKLTKPSIKLNQQLQAKLPQTKIAGTAQKSELDASYIFVEIDSGEYSELGSDRVLPAASTIKLPILIALATELLLGDLAISATKSLGAK
jgi:beta-lactamase class A